MSKKVILITQVYKDIPIGVYDIEYEELTCYLIRGFFHHKNRFIECSSLLLELF
jgi:hypothetical protein